jgi:hypothetical protein
MVKSSPELRSSDCPVVQDFTFLPSVPQPMREKIQDPCPGQRLQKITYMEIGGGLIRKDGQFVQSRISTFRQAESDLPERDRLRLEIRPKFKSLTCGPERQCPIDP